MPFLSARTDPSNMATLHRSPRKCSSLPTSFSGSNSSSSGFVHGTAVAAVARAMVFDVPSVKLVILIPSTQSNPASLPTNTL